MSRMLGFVLLLSLASCEAMAPHVETARAALEHFCHFKQSAIVQILASAQLRAAGETVCRAVGLGLGEPG